MSTLIDHLTTDSPVVEPTPKRWTREEYYKLAEQGWFQDQRVELINGEIIVLSPQTFSHAWSIDALLEILRVHFGAGYWVRTQLPLLHNQDSEPEPDLSIVRGNRNDFNDHPTTAQLVVEVSKTTLLFDTTTKANLYASMKVPDYWVLDLENRQLLVFRRPAENPDSKFGHRYEQMEVVSPEGKISPLEKPTASISIAHVLPPEKTAKDT